MSLSPLPMEVPQESPGCKEEVTHCVWQTCLRAEFLVFLSYSSHSLMKCVSSRTESGAKTIPVADRDAWVSECGDISKGADET